MIIIIMIFFSACDSEHVFNEYKYISEGIWKANEKISFQFNIKDTITKRNVFINLRNDKNYKYSNLFLITALNFPNGTKIVDTLQYEMADAAGNFLGTGFSDIKENKLFYREEKVFPISGEYSFEVYQAMRKNGQTEGIKFLEGILDVGFSIENITK